jgi:hypothetical protein
MDMKKRIIIVLVVVCMVLCGSIAFVADLPDKCEKTCIKYQRKCCDASPARWDVWCDEAKKECKCKCEK